MFQTCSAQYLKFLYYNRISSILTPIFSHPQKTHSTTAALIRNPKTPSTSSEKNHTDQDLSPLRFSRAAKTVISKCSHHWDTNKGEDSITLSLKDYLLRLSNISPGIIRKFWRVSVLKPQDVLEILLGFESDREKCEAEFSNVVKSLWGIFKWARGQYREFLHFPRSCKIMASLLVEDGNCREAEYLLLSRKESRGFLLDCEELFSNLIEGYLGEFELDNALSIYGKMRRMYLVPSFSSYKAMLGYLFELNETELIYDVYVDMIKMGMGMGENVEEKEIHDNVIRLLCVGGKIQEARDLVKKIMSFGIKPSDLVIRGISSGYCHKKDYNDLLSLFTEAKVEPNVELGNKILFSFCSNFGIEQASVFLQKLEEISFCPNEISFGILIGFSCREGKLKDAFFFISDIFSRGLKPHVYSYNALLSEIFTRGMWIQARDVLVEMQDMGVSPNSSTFRVSLAGFCKARQFDEVKAIVSEMADRNLTKLSSFEDLLTKGFMILGFSPSDVRIKRDNDKRLSKTEFFDNLGNGLYLDTDMDEYEKKIARVLEDAMVLDFNTVIAEKIRTLDVKSIQIMVDEMAKWGQELSLPVLSSLLNRLCGGSFSVENINHHLGVMFKSIYQLDNKTLNILVQTYSKKGFNFKARVLFDGMLRRGYTIENGTYSALLFDSCKKGDLRSFRCCCELAVKYNWSPVAKDGNALLGYLCKNIWFNEAFELFTFFLSFSPYYIVEAFHSLLEGLCSQGYTSIACVLLDEFSNIETFLDHTAYSCIVRGFCREKKYMEASKVFGKMLSLNLSPSVDVSTRIISRLCWTNFEKSVEYGNLCLMYQPHALIPVKCALIYGLCESGRMEKAACLFKEVHLNSLILDSNVNNALIGGYCGENNLEKVKELLGVMIKKNLSISISSYSKMVRLACAGGEFFLAISLKELMLRKSDFPQLVLHNILIFQVSSTRNSFLLDEIVSMLRKNGLDFDNVTYDYVIQGFLLCGNASRSLHYLTAMISRNFKPSNRSLRKAISHLCENGEIGQALELNREMELRSWTFSSIIQCTIIDVLLGNGNIHEAEIFLDKLSVSGDSIPNNITYDYLIKQFYHHGRVDTSIELLNVMLRKGSIPTSMSYDYIIRALCDSCRWDEALDYYTEMFCRDLKPSLVTFGILICGLSECGRLEEGERIFQTMVGFGENPRREVFESLISKYRSQKNIKKASEIMKIMQEKGYVPDFDTHWSLISDLSQKNDKCENKGFLSSILSGFGAVTKRNGSDMR
ncbi:hypothetical protein OROGR_023542 [Orobanche gracilis]